MTAPAKRCRTTELGNEDEDEDEDWNAIGKPDPEEPAAEEHDDEEECPKTPPRRKARPATLSETVANTENLGRRMVAEMGPPILEDSRSRMRSRRHLAVGSTTG